MGEVLLLLFDPLGDHLVDFWPLRSRDDPMITFANGRSFELFVSTLDQSSTLSSFRLYLFLHSLGDPIVISQDISSFVYGGGGSSSITVS